MKAEEKLVQKEIEKQYKFLDWLDKNGLLNRGLNTNTDISLAYDGEGELIQEPRETEELDDVDLLTEDEGLVEITEI